MINSTRSNKMIIFLALVISVTAFSQVRLPKLISDGMVLQRDAELKIWGWAAVGEKISIEFIGSTYNITADNKGDWSIVLPKLSAGGPYEMNLKASNSVTIHNIMIGDVWVCSGQSNMELTMERVSPLYGTEIANSENPLIRYFEVPDKYDFNNPQKDLSSGRWEKANPRSVLNFSAVSYFFGKEVYEKYKVPVGLVNAALGGSPAESWISEESLREFPEYYNEARRFKDASLIQQIQNEDRTRIDEWYRRSTRNDEGYKNPKNLWYSPKYNASAWQTMKIPGYWADGDLGSVNGVVWFRKEIDVPETMTGKPVQLNLGRIVDADSVYVNGIFVGTTSYQYPPRRYSIPAGILKSGQNVIVIRVTNSEGRGGFVEDKPYELIAGDERIDLNGDWQYRLGAKMEPLKGETFIRWKPLGLYNAMIAPLINYPIKGVIWYQGEANAKKPVDYSALMQALIKDWRKKWDLGDFPFLFVQLPNFMEAKSEPSESNWALIREAQLKILTVPNTAMAVAIDIGEWNDIHPLNKKDVGKRLFLAAQKVAYDDNTVNYSGPIYKSMKVSGNKIILSFDNIDGGLIAKDGQKLKGFAIAGADKHFVWAQARIENDKVVVWSDEISNPVAVRYAWADNPAGVNLYNKGGLPASPFRTDEY
ncbi:MAG: sialate O-acetylesterase [Candidatus Neomarinimicrobiota bacterium]